MMHTDSDLEYTESAHGASAASSSSEETRKSRERVNKKTKKPKSCDKKKKEKDKDNKEPKKYTCPHCKKYHRKKPHRVEPDKCMWNKKYKGYRFKSICDELEVDFKPLIKFTSDLGGCGEGR
jgi:hypothetical protein